MGKLELNQFILWMVNFITNLFTYQYKMASLLRNKDMLIIYDIIK